MNMIAILARQQAIKEAKRQLQAQGLRPHHTAPKEITLQAEAYLASHRAELIEEVKSMIAGSPKLQKLYDREQLKLQKRLEGRPTGRGT